MKKLQFAAKKIGYNVTNDGYARYLRYRRGSNLDALMDNPTLSKCDKIKILNDTMADFVTDDQNAVNAFGATFHSMLNDQFNEDMTKLNESNGKTIWTTLLRTIFGSDAISEVPLDAVKLSRKFNGRFRQYENYCAEHNLDAPIIGQFDTNLLSDETKAKMKESMDNCLAIIKDKFAHLVLFMRPNYEGVGRETTSPIGPKYGYNSHRSIKVKKENTTDMKYGIELEGAMSPNEYQAACSEMATTEFDGGYILDSRNLIMGTEDSSLPANTGVEGVMAPMSMKKGLAFGNKVEEILKKHGFKRECLSTAGGLHVHIDADKFKNLDTIRKLIDKTYGYSESEFLQFFERCSNSYCSGNKNNLYYFDREGIKLDGQFTKDNKQLGYLNETYKLRNARYNLINTANIRGDENDQNKIVKGTVEIRGFYSNVKIAKAISIINNKFLEGVIQCV